MNIALITAAGVGSRTHQSVPKQFLSVNDKPIVIYTLEKYQKHPEIDKIVVVCLKGWENCLDSYAKQYGISKLTKIVPGGETGYDSIMNGLLEINKLAEKDDIVVIHDGNRPGIEPHIITDCIKTAREKGNAVTYVPTNEVVFDVENDNQTLLDRDKILRTQTPHAASLEFALDIYRQAGEKNLQDKVAFCSILHQLGHKINFVMGNEKNFKITYAEDIDLFKGLIYLEKHHDL